MAAAVDEETQGASQLQTENQSEVVTDVEQPSTLSDRLKCDNDGAKFFEVMNVVGTEALALSVNDVAGGLHSLSSDMFTNGKKELTDAVEAAKTVDIKNGWDGFKESITVPETKYSLMRAPLGAIFLLGASLLYALFFVIFVSSKYGPSAIKSAAVVIREKSLDFNEKVIAPLKQTLRPMIKNAREKVEKAIQERSAVADVSAGAEEDDLESKHPEEDDA